MKVTVPQPCDADWNKMTPEDQRRFCSRCQISLVDFTIFTDKELVDYLHNAKGKICGHFDNNQLGRELQVETPYTNRFTFPKLAAGVALFASLATPLNANVNNKPDTEWVKTEKPALPIVTAHIVDEPVARDSRYKYIRVLVYKDPKHKVKYTDSLTVFMGFRNRFDESDSAYFKSADDDNSYLIKVPDSLIGQTVYLHFTNGKHNWYSSINAEDYMKDSSLTIFIKNGDIGVSKSIGLYNRYAKHGWEKLLFWKKKKRVFRTLGCPSF